MFEVKNFLFSIIYFCFSHQSQNRLSDLVAEHLDHLHYLNDILCLNITDLNQVLTEHLLHKLLIPLYICSLRSVRKQSETNMEMATQNLGKVLNRNLNLGESAIQPSNGKVSSVVALFLLSQVFLIISHPPLIQALAWIILKTNQALLEQGMDKLLEYYDKEVKQKSDSKDLPENAAQNVECVVNSDGLSMKEEAIDQQQNITDEEKQRLATTPSDNSGFTDKPFLETVFNALDCGENDYTALFALCLLYALANNKGKTKIRKESQKVRFSKYLL